MQKKIVILGAGISGLSLGWFLKQKGKHNFIILEKENRAGGYLATDLSSGFLFEKGPRTFRTAQCSSLLQLASSLNLKEKIIPCDEMSKRRYLWWEGRLLPFPSHPFSFITSPLTRDMLFAFLKERNVLPLEQEETVEEFARRRFNQAVAERLFNPMVLGIYAGDYRKLSITSCFPTFKRWEQDYGSVIKGFWKERKQRPTFPFSLFSFQNGVQTLVDALTEKLHDHLVYNQPISKLEKTEKGLKITTSQDIFFADQVFSSLPAHAMEPLVQEIDAESAKLFNTIRSESITIVHLGYSEDVLERKGFGYLVPSSQDKNILGVVFDSAIFPQHNQNKKETRLTAMLKGTAFSKKEALQTVLYHLKEQLGLSFLPHSYEVHFAINAIPQYEIGHRKKITQLQERIKDKCPGLILLGNYIQGVSVNDCIVLAKQITDDKRSGE